MRKAAPHSRRGFTFVEVTVATTLTVFLAMLLASTWGWTRQAGFPTDVVARGRLLQEIDLAVAALSRDLCGSLAIPTSFDNVNQDRWIAWQHPTNTELRLCYDVNPDGNPDWSATTDAVIRYYLADDPNAAFTTKVLRREDCNAGTTFAVARHVDAMIVDSETISGSEFVKMQLTFKYQRADSEYTRTLTLKTRAPQ